MEEKKRGWSYNIDTKSFGLAMLVPYTIMPSKYLIISHAPHTQKSRKSDHCWPTLQFAVPLAWFQQNFPN